jgi:hypothetical protein
MSAVAIMTVLGDEVTPRFKANTVLAGPFPPSAGGMEVYVFRYAPAEGRSGVRTRDSVRNSYSAENDAAGVLPVTRRVGRRGDPPPARIFAVHAVHTGEARGIAIPISPGSERDVKILGSSSIWLQASRVMLRDAEQSDSAAFQKLVERFPVSGWPSGVERRVGRMVRTQ